MTCSIRFSSARPSPSAISSSRSRASGVSGSRAPSSRSARCASRSRSAGERRSSTITCARDSSAAFSSKLGFSVVAPTRRMVPSSISGRKLSCWALLKRWISSTKSSVPWPCSRRSRAASNTLRSSGTPEKMALIWTKARSVSSASSRAMVVLPTPGGPQRISEPRLPAASIEPSGPSGESTFSCPMTSARLCGRSRSASGRCAGSRAARRGGPASGRSKRSAMAGGGYAARRLVESRVNAASG